MQLAIDEAWAKVDPQAAKDAGYSAIIGYVSQDTTGKNLTKAQVTAIHAAGLSVGLVYEYATQSALGGAVAGERDAGIAVPHALDLGAPPRVCLYAAADWQVQDSQMGTVYSYAMADYSAKMNAGYRAGIYGSYYLVKYLRDRGYPGLLWQTYAWSNGLLLSGVNLYQNANGIHVAGANVDRDVIETIDWGQWTPEGTAVMTSPEEHFDLVNAYAYLFTGGPSCGATVDPKYRAALDGAGNALASQMSAVLGELADVKAALAALPTTQTGVTQPMVDQAIQTALANPTFVQQLAANIAAHIKIA